MSNVLNFDVYKNTLKRRDGFSPVGGEFAYSRITCHFQEGDDWDSVHIVTAGFYVNTKHVVASNPVISNHSLTVNIPAQLLKKHEQIKFGLLGSVMENNEAVMTIATNVVSIDVARGIVSDELDEEAAEPGLYERLLAALNAGLQNNIDYVDAQNAAQDTVIATKADKTYVDNQNAAQDAVIAAKADKTYVDSQNAAQDEVIATKANSADVYTKTEANSRYERIVYKVNDLSTLTASDAYPTANAVIRLVNSVKEALIATKADKTYVDAQNATQDSAIATKADKTYVDNQNTAQDAAIAIKADKTYVDNQNTAQDSAIAAKADKTYVDNQNTAQDAAIATKANSADVYTKTETDSRILKKAVSAFDGENDEVLKYMSKEPQTDSAYAYSNVNTSLSERKDIPGAFSITTPEGTTTVRIVDCQSGEEWRESAHRSHEIRNLIPGRLYRYYSLDTNMTELDSGSCTARGQVRMIDVPTINGTRNVFNIRDLGGWACDGGAIKYGLVFRGGRLNGTNPSVNNSLITLDSEQIAYFKNVLHIADEIDLRTSSEISRDSISGSALGQDVGWINKTLGYYQNSLTDSYSENYAILINRLAQNLSEGKVTYIHCNSGADRSAQLCMFIEAICGVSQIDMERDYELTSYAFEYQSGQIDRRRNQSTNACWKLLMQALDSETGSTIQEKAVNFLIRKGVTESSIDMIRKKLVERSEGPDISGKFDKSKIVKRATGAQVGLSQDTVFSTQAADDYLAYFLNQYYTASQVENKIEEWIDGVLSNDPDYNQKLLIDNTVDQIYNPNGHYILYYIDSVLDRHNIFDFNVIPMTYTLTAQDKTDIANIVLQQLPTTQGVLYGNAGN